MTIYEKEYTDLREVAKAAVEIVQEYNLPMEVAPNTFCSFVINWAKQHGGMKTFGMETRN